MGNVVRNERRVETRAQCRKEWTATGRRDVLPTFFCSRTTLVHFFSKRPSYFFAVVASKTSSPSPISARSAAAVLVRLLEER
jgi:hypothetical protein